MQRPKALYSHVKGPGSTPGPFLWSDTIIPKMRNRLDNVPCFNQGLMSSELRSGNTSDRSSEGIERNACVVRQLFEEATNKVSIT